VLKYGIGGMLVGRPLSADLVTLALCRSTLVLQLSFRPSKTSGTRNNNESRMYRGGRRAFTQIIAWSRSLNEMAARMELHGFCCLGLRFVFFNPNTYRVEMVGERWCEGW